MAYQSIGLGSSADDGTGDSLRIGGDKVNDNFVELYTLLGNATTLSSGISSTATVITLTNPVITGPTISGVVGGTQTSATITTVTSTTVNAGTLVITAASITDSSGAISFGNENLTTTGTFQASTITSTTAVVPDASDGAALGTTSLEWSDLFLADGAVINFGDDQDITLTHTVDTGLTTNGTFQATTITATTAFVPDASDGAALGTTALEFSDLFLADGALIYFGDDQEITLTHVADTGINLKHAASGDDKYPTLTLQTGDTDIASADKLGVINFQAPDEGTGTDAILVAAGIEAVSEGDFSSSNNATKLSFKTASTAVAAETMSLSSGGNLTVTGTITGSHGVSIAIGKALAVAMLF